MLKAVAQALAPISCSVGEWLLGSWTVGHTQWMLAAYCWASSSSTGCKETVLNLNQREVLQVKTTSCSEIHIWKTVWFWSWQLAEILPQEILTCCNLLTNIPVLQHVYIWPFYKYHIWFVKFERNPFLTCWWRPIFPGPHWSLSVVVPFWMYRWDRRRSFGSQISLSRNRRLRLPVIWLADQLLLADSPSWKQ